MRMGHKHTKEEILAGAVLSAFDDGLASLSFGRVAKQMGISDRIVVYYFPTKEDLIGEVLMAVGIRLQETLATAFTARAADHIALLRRAWPILATADADPVFALFFEAGGLAASRTEPYYSLVPQLMAAWIEWTAELIDGPPTRRRSEAEAAVALLDGLLFMRQLAGHDVASRAAKRLGLR
jgi:AcrR family transcriptional regulator